MSVSKYEAAAIYHYVNQKTKSENKYLILDLDDCSYGYCGCSDDNKTLLYHSWTSINVGLWDACVKAVKKLVDKKYPYDIDSELRTQLVIANSAFQNYYLSDRAVNSEAFSFANQVITCGDLEKELHFVQEKIEELVKRINKQLPEENLLESNIIILGKAQEFFPVMYYIRKLISFDPLLPDARFKNDELRDGYTEIVKLGNEYLEELKTLKNSYALMGFDMSSNSVVSIWSAQKGQQEMDISKLQFSPPILVYKGDKLLINRNDTNLEITIPYSFAPMDSDLIEVAIGVQDNTDTLFIRRCRFQTRIYNVKLS